MRQVTVDLIVGHTKLINDVARKTADRLGWNDVDELISFGREQLIIKSPKWDPAKAKFSTFAVWVLRNAMFDYVKRQRRLVPSSVGMVDGEEVNWLEQQADPQAHLPLPSRLSDMMDGCSEAAKEVITICLSTELGDVFNYRGRKPIEKIRAILLGLGWDRRTTHKVFNEINGIIECW